MIKELLECEYPSYEFDDYIELENATNNFFDSIEENLDIIIKESVKICVNLFIDENYTPDFTKIMQEAQVIKEKRKRKRINTGYFLEYLFAVKLGNNRLEGLAEKYCKEEGITCEEDDYDCEGVYYIVDDIFYWAIDKSLTDNELKENFAKFKERILG